ncbi:telomeric DNA binding protein 1 [Actinidia rufa]|uniref:Telomeric DNA binding protein 1 n=1 Tax=Actinidia rufa TaxID=165716 RepID=A0A7J0E6Y9_9ERIC|nr:telomeric DNA binding protein 1 [Actinidia rufa]
MVLKKRIEYGFGGYRLPVIPRGPRSVRRRGAQKVEDSQICAFELLAAVAGKLLQESESSASSNAAEGKVSSGIYSDGIKQEQLEEGEALRSECIDQGSFVESAIASGLAAQKCNLKSTSREFPHSIYDKILEGTLINFRSDFSKKVGHDLKLGVPDNKKAVEKSPCKVEAVSPNYGESCDDYIDGGIERQLDAEGNHNRNVDLTVDNTYSSKYPMEICVDIHQLINSDTSVQLPSYRDSVANASFPRHRNNVKVGSRDDGKNSIGCNRPSSKIRAFRPQPRIGHQRMRKLLTSKYWKLAPKLKDCEFSNNDGCMKPISRCRKALYTSERIQREVPFKKRKLCYHSSTPAHDLEGSSESISNSPKKGVYGDKIGSVKFSIKSFKVPELYVEVPVTATVGSLKRTVMDAVTAILESGLHVGVIVQGKKVKDDNKTLQQTGICHTDVLDTLGFTLEPGSAIALPSLSLKDPPILLPCETRQQLSSSAASPILDSGVFNASFEASPVTNMNHSVESKHELVSSPTEVLTDGTAVDSRALVALPAVHVEALAVVPVNQKTRRPELVQRRTRRPFSVSEVEALVEAVEKLGTGRWRDVKLRSFEDADHRTYVDLKDKWKTLVHTASISPQQRRGAPVPQDLLDRVLSAHTYWSHHQSKLHGKHQSEPLTISEAQVGTA